MSQADHAYITPVEPVPSNVVRLRRPAPIVAPEEIDRALLMAVVASLTDAQRRRANKPLGKAINTGTLAEKRAAYVAMNMLWGAH